MGMAVPQLYQPHTLPQALGQANTLRQQMVQSHYQPQQIQNQLALEKAKIQEAENVAAYGNGQYGQILTALNNPNIAPQQKEALEAALTINSLYRPGMPNNPTTNALQSGIISQNPNLANTIQAGSGQTPQELYEIQQEQYKSKTDQQKARAQEARQRGEYYEAGGAKGAFLKKWMNDPELKGVITPELMAQTIVGNLTTGSPPAVKAQAAANVALKYGNTGLADSLDKWSQKEGTPSAILNKLSAYDMIDKGFEVMMPEYIPILQYYSGPTGTAQLKLDIANASAGRSTSPEYDKYKEFTTSTLPALADQLRKTWGTSITPEMNTQLQGMIGFKDSWDEIQQNPEIVEQRYQALKQLLAAEVSALKDYSAPSIIGNTTGAQGQSAGQDAAIQQSLQSIQSTMNNQQATGNGSQAGVLVYDPATGKW